MQSNLTKSFPLFLAGLEKRRAVGRGGKSRGGGGKPYVKIRLEKLYEGQL
jgi:hypothetical protein